MRVRELLDLLAALDPEEHVYLGSRHVRLIVREHARPYPVTEAQSHDCPDCGASHRGLAVVGYVRAPAGIALYGEAVGTWKGDPAPPVQYRGRWTKAARAAIDAHTEEPDR